MTTTRQPNTDRAIEIAEDERALVEAEQAAFRRFARRLDDVEPASPGRVAGGPSGGGAVTITAENRVAGTQLQSVRTAYRETVLDAAEEDESLETHLAREVSEPVAHRVANGTALTPVLYRTLTAIAERALEDRTDLKQLLDRELRSLRGCREQIGDLESSAYSLAVSASAADREERERAADRLSTLERDCERLLARRQRLIRNQAVPALDGSGELDLQEYLYDDLDVVYPVLSDLTDCVEAIRRARRRCLD